MRQILAIWRHPFWRRVATLLSGSVIAQGIGLALLPLLGNLYPETDFGLQGIFIAVVHTLVIAANGGYEQTIMLPKKEEDAHSLLRLSLLLNAGFCVLVGIFMALLSPGIWDLLKAPEMDRSWGWILLSLWLEGNIQPLRTMLNRQQAYRMLSVSRVVQAVVSGSLMVGLGWEQPDARYLLIGWTAGQATNWLCLQITYWFQYRHGRLAWSAIRKVAYAYRDFPTHAVGAGWLNSFSRQLPFFLLTGFFGLEATGYFLWPTGRCCSPCP